MQDETTQQQEQAQEAEAAPKRDLAWELSAKAEGDAFDKLAKLIEPVEEDLAPTREQLRRFTSTLEKNHATPEKHHRKTLPSLDQNWWDAETETLTCYDENAHVAELWRKVELS